MRRLSLGAISIALLTAISCGMIKGTHATTILISENAARTWLDNSVDLNVTLDRENSPDPDASYWNIPCRDSEYKEFNPGLGGLRSVTGCLQTTNYGRVGSSILLADSEVGYLLKDPAGNVLNNFYAIPGTNHLLLMSGKRLYVYRNFPENFKPLKQLGQIQYLQLTNNPWDVNNRLKFSNGSPFAGFQPGSFNFSADGRHMSLNQGRYQIVANLTTLEVTTFGTTSMQPWGTTPKLRTSLNYSGRLVFTADSEFKTYKLYDISDCTGAGIDQPRNCKSRDLYSLLHQKIPGLRFVTTSKFTAEDTIEFYAVVNDGVQNRTHRYLLSLPGSERPSFQYLALGDSFASGEGARNYKAITDTADNRCHISQDSYPYLIKKKLSLVTTESVACSGAKIKDIYGSGQYFNSEPQSGHSRDTPEFDSDIYNSFLPGYRFQFEFLSRYKAKVASVSIGGNDIGFAEVIQKCVMGGTCLSSPADRSQLLALIKAQFPVLADTYQKAMESSKGKLYALGYPYIADPNGNCALNVHLSREEIKTSEEIVTDLNFVIKQAAAKAGAYYVDVSEALKGHKLCETASWNVAMNGLTAGNDVLPLIGYPLGKESYHPNDLGHRLLSETILEKTADFTAPMPLAEQNITVNSMPSALLKGQLPVNMPKPIIENQLAEAVVLAGTKIIKSITNYGLFLSTGSVLRAELHSEPVVVGSATAANPSTLDLNITLPENIAAGAHTLHLYGDDISGRPIDIYKDILIIASTEDYDGDGISNGQDKCNFVPLSLVDSDKDNIDDSCDGRLTLATEIPPAQNPTTPVTPRSPNTSPGSSQQEQPAPPSPQVVNKVKSVVKQAATTAKQTKVPPALIVTGSIITAVAVIVRIVFSFL